MSAAADWSRCELVDLQRAGLEELGSLLAEETRTWRELLDWDFGPSAELVLRFTRMRSLRGFALLARGAAAGYIYYVVEEHKALIGDMYLRPECRSAEHELTLLEAALSGITGHPGVERVEAQVMLFEPRPVMSLPLPRHAAEHDRFFLALELASATLPPVGKGVACLEPWVSSAQAVAAQLIAGAYCGHVDSEINDQYRSVAGAARFLQNIIQYPGCGSFYAPGSFLAFDRRSGRPCGLCLSSLVAPDVGHITQVCVLPSWQGEGVGYALLRRSLLALHERGCRKVSLTVTAANRPAARLYERMGFRTVRRFPAYVWEGLGRAHRS